MARRVLRTRQMQWHTRLVSFGIPVSSKEELEYPSSDGQPLGETDLHVDAILAARQVLELRFGARADVAVGANLIFYYEEGNSGARFSPDVYVAIGAPKRKRRVYKIWQEPVPPSFVMEVSSKGTWLEDDGNKKALCAKLGIAEYFLFDPEGEYLDPVLQGFRLIGKRYQPIAPRDDGSVESIALGLRLLAEESLVRFIDPATMTPLAQPMELAIQLHEATALADAANARADAANARAAAAEAELVRLRAQLEKK
jgi:Uma2 family endonuclease